MASIPNPNKQPKIDHDRDPNYSVDEMMANLKRRDQRKKKQPNSSKGELITREDGSQAIKVRRKKRRSKQTNKKETPRTNSKIKWAVFLLAGISFIFFIAFSVFIIAKYNGRNFKAQTESNISNLTGANKTKITQIRVTPISAKAQKADLTWNTDSFLKNANFVNIRANIKPTSFLRNDWVGEEIVSSAGKIHLQAPQPKTEKLNTNNLISPYQFRSYRCDQLSLYFGNDEKKSPAISNALVSLRKLANGQNQIVFRHGKIRIENDSVMDLPSAILTLNENNARLEALINAKKKP